jgi:hypothetical protein
MIDISYRTSRCITVAAFSLFVAAVAVDGCERPTATPPHGVVSRLEGGGDSTGQDTVPCVQMDSSVLDGYRHCPLTAPADSQAIAIQDGIDAIYPGCSWMQTYLQNLYIHGNINMYSGFTVTGGLTTFADSHGLRDSTLYPGARMHINIGDSYAYIHWIIRHEAAHLHHGGGVTEAQADSIANSCGADQKPYN